MPVVRSALLALLIPILVPPGYAAGWTIGQVIPTLQLKDGTELRTVSIVTVGSSTVMAKWEGGRGTIAFSQLPDEIQEELARLVVRPKATAPSIPQQESARKDAKGTAAPARDDLMARLDAENAEALRRPEPKMPPSPRPIEGSIGKLDGKPAVLRGQVFVSSRGGINYKMGAVTVRVVGATELPELEERAVGAMQPLFDYYKVMSQRALAKSQFELSTLYLEGYSTALANIQSLFPAGPRAQTDADGMFELKHTLRAPYFILATASRSVGKNTERYEWKVPSSDVPPDGRVLLSNANMK